MRLPGPHAGPQLRLEDNECGGLDGWDRVLDLLTGGWPGPGGGLGGCARGGPLRQASAHAFGEDREGLVCLQQGVGGGAPGLCGRGGRVDIARGCVQQLGEPVGGLRWDAGCGPGLRGPVMRPRCRLVATHQRPGEGRTAQEEHARGDDDVRASWGVRLEHAPTLAGRAGGTRLVQCRMCRSSC